MAVKERIKKLLNQLNTGIYEKEEVMALALLSSIAGESIFLLGPPGVAKSLIARRLKYAYKDAKVFEYLMSRFSTPDEIFGPVSISELKKDKYVRIVKNYLPDAEVVFLDEIWKAGPSIQNALLTILNEKKFRNGEKEFDVPMKALISASNELPNREEAKKQGQSLEALWDRFLVRFEVKGIKEQENFEKMITMPYISAGEEDAKLKKIIEQLSDDKEWNQKINDIKVPENVLNVIQVIIKKIAVENEKDDNKGKIEKQISVSDRRWRKIVRLMRTSAFLNDREEVDLMDCFLIKHCIWDEEGQRDRVRLIVSEAIEENGYTKDIDFTGIKDELTEFNKEINKYTHEVIPIKRKVNKVYEIEGEKYLRILNLTFNYNMDDLIKLSDVNSAKDSYIETRRWRKDLGDKDTVYIKKGKNKHSLILSNDSYSYSQGYEHQIEVIDVKKDKIFTKKPHPKVIEDWDKEAGGFLQKIGDMRNQLEQYRKKDLEHLRKNLFVDPSLADIVESHITATQKEIEKIELEIKKTQNDYTNIEDNKVVRNAPKPKQIQTNKETISDNSESNIEDYVDFDDDDYSGNDDDLEDYNDPRNDDDWDDDDDDD